MARIQGILCVFLLLALLQMPYGYYTFLRLAVFFFAGYMFFLRKQIEGLTVVNVIFLTIALVYNPIIKVYFNRDTWAVINILTVIFFLYPLFFKKSRLDKMRKNLINMVLIFVGEVEKCHGIYDNPPEALLNLADFYRDFVFQMKDSGYEIRSIQELNADKGNKKILCFHTFSKYPDKPSKEYEKYAMQGIYIQDTIEYQEEITVQYFYDVLKAENFMLIDGERTHKIDMSLFNLYLTPLIKRFFIDNL